MSENKQMHRRIDVLNDAAWNCPPETERRFWQKVAKGAECWEWQGNTSKGYGRFWINDRAYRSHRFAYRITIGVIPLDLNVLHHCDNPICVRPDHLFVGTDSDNVNDKVSKGRARGNASVHHSGQQNGAHIHPETRARGERNGLAKLTREQVRLIRQKYSAGASQRSLGREFGVHASNIAFIVQGKTWQDM